MFGQQLWYGVARKWNSVRPSTAPGRLWITGSLLITALRNYSLRNYHQTPG